MLRCADVLKSEGEEEKVDHSECGLWRRGRLRACANAWRNALGHEKRHESDLRQGKSLESCVITATSITLGVYCTCPAHAPSARCARIPLALTFSM